MEIEGNIMCFPSLEDAYQYIKEEEIRTGARYVSQRSRNPGLMDITTLDRYYIRWQDIVNKADGGPNIPYDGTPFVVLGNISKECHQGPQRTHKQTKEQIQDHDFLKKRRIVHPSKKQDCKARVRIRTVLRFPSYKIEGNLDGLSKWKRHQMASKIKAEFSPSTPREFRVYLEMPNENDHTSHLTGELAGFTQNIDKSLIEKIHQLVGEGVRSVEEMRRHLNTYVANEIQPTLGLQIQITNRRFYPTDRDIRNHINSAITNTRFSTNDQENLRKMIERWQHCKPEDNFFFRPVTDENNTEPAASFLFIFQSKWQQHLLEKYGQEICILDATYNTTSFDLPLFFLCVNTNVGYFVVASFLLGKETKANIKEALDILAKWNPAWHPTHFMCDFDGREIGALESSFPGCMVFLCDFHREQAWERWVKTSKHGVSCHSDVVLSMLRSIARSSTEPEYHDRVKVLRESEVYKNVTLFSNWVEKTWISNYKRWVSAFRTSLFNVRVSTTNGLERQHKDLKERYLKSSVSSRSLSGMIEILVNSFVPDSIRRYKRYNVESLDSYKSLAAGLPDFLKNRPQKFLQHCINRLPPYATFSARDVVQDENTSKFSVFNQDSGSTYSISFENVMPSCSCPDWKKNHWPCKHMLAVFTLFPNQGWNVLHQEYTGNPVFCLDDDIIEHSEVKNIESHVGVTSQPLLASDDVPNERSLRQTCFDTIKTITSGLYGINDLETLQEINTSLSALDVLISSKQEKKDGLPVRCTFKGGNQKKNIKKRKSFQPGIAHAVGTDQSFQTTYGHMQVSVETAEEENTGEIINDVHGRALQNIWSSAPDHTPVLSIGPYVLTRNSFHTLKNFVSDEIIDAYLVLLTRELNTLHINCVVCTAIFEGAGDRDLHNLLQNENLFYYENCIGVINEGGNHWTLVIIEPKEKHITYINPLGELRGREESVLMHWYKFMNERLIGGVDRDRATGWKIRSVDHSKQTDGSSCGIYVLKFAEQFLNGGSLVLRWNSSSVLNERRRIGRCLIAEGNNILNRIDDDQLDVCDPVTDDQSQTEPASSYSRKDDDQLDVCEPVTDDQSQTEPASSDSRKDDDQLDVCEPVTDDQLQTEPDSSDSRKDDDQLRTDVAAGSSNRVNLLDDSLHNLRQRKMKRKRSSFIYTSNIKKGKRLYCKCQKPYDKRRFMVYCNQCQEWFHLDCLNIQKKDIPGKRERFICQDCKEQDTQYSKDSTFNIANAFCDQNFAEVVKHLHSIMECEDLHCEEAEHKRHHLYCKNPIKFYNDARRLHCFGTGVFSQQTIQNFCEKLSNELVYQHKDTERPYSLRYRQIRSPKSSELQSIFKRYALQADHYLMHVCLKEGLIWLLCKKTGCPYQNADEQCSMTETSISYLTKKSK